MCPIYEFRAVSPTGSQQKGILEAETAKIARNKLKKQGLIVTDISERSSTARSKNVQIPFFGGRVTNADLTLMTRQLASLVKANIPLVEALSALVDQTEKPILKIVLSNVRQDVNEGVSLAKALHAHPRAFDTVYINMVEAGESSGTLSLVLKRLADLKESQMRLRSKVISGMTYPALMMCVAFVLMLVIFTFVIPKFTKIFVSMKKEIPAITKLLMGISSTFINYWFILIPGAILGAYLIFRYIHSPAGKPKWDALKLRLPVFGTLVRMIAVTRFATTMSTLLGSGVPILTAMNIAKNLVDNAPISKAIHNARENITEGQSIAEPLRKSGEFPPMVIHMIAIGEKTGELPEMLRNIGETFEEQVNAKIERLTSLLEPIMIIIMGLVVAFIVFSVIVPLMDISAIK